MVTAKQFLTTAIRFSNIASATKPVNEVKAQGPQQLHGIGRIEANGGPEEHSAPLKFGLGLVSSHLPSAELTVVRLGHAWG